MQKDSIIVVLMLLLVWLGTSLIRVESERYALYNSAIDGTCKFDFARPSTEFHKCIDSMETRTSDAWHLMYALRIL
jgi:hypothetical protein